MENKTYSKEAYDKESLKIINNTDLTQEDYAIMFTCITILMETFLRAKNIQSNDLSESLRELKFSDECVDDITKVLISNHSTLTAHFHDMKALKPIDNLKTRINISMGEKNSTTIILRLEHNGKIQIINLSLKQFHRFRLAVATILTEMYNMEGKKN